MITAHTIRTTTDRTRPNHRRRLLASLLLSGATLLGGCHAWKRIPAGPHDNTPSYHDNFGLRIDYPEVAQCATPVNAAAETTTDPLSLQDPANLNTVDMTLEEAVRLAVSQSPVIRNIGGTVVGAPAGAPTIYDPALTASNPSLGSEAALAAFDAQYNQVLQFSNQDTPPNINSPIQLQFIAFTARNALFTAELVKPTATGASFTVRNQVNYNRQPFDNFNNAFPSVFTGFVEAEWRQPLLQGAGVMYNRIAGFSNQNIPGQYNGVLLARINEDVALADFENQVIALVADVEQAYWDLLTAYRVLDATIKGRESAQQTYQFQAVRLEVGAGRTDEEAQARSQFYSFQAQVESALGGPTGLYALEQRLRYLIGFPATDGRLLKPVTDPTDVRVVFDWQDALSQALDRRVEIRRQRFSVKRRELELYAARLDRRPRLDAVTSYRYLGLGDNLLGDPGTGFDSFAGAISNGNFQEGTVGLELSFPVGFRLASLAIQNAKLNLSRERAVLAETELRISHDLSDAARQIAVNHKLVETNYNRYQADLVQVEVLERRYREGNDNINFLLQAQQQLVQSETAFYQALSNYNLSIRDFHRQKGSLLAYNQIQLTEGQWCPGAQADAYQAGRHLEPRLHPDRVCAPRPLTTGPFDPSAIQGNAYSGQPIMSDAEMVESDLPVEEIGPPIGDDERPDAPEVFADPRSESLNLPE